MTKRPNPEWIDDDNPEWTDEVFAQARPTHEVLPQLFGKALAQEMLRPTGLPRPQRPEACSMAQEVVEPHPKP
ncbi:MAG: hypothetical protein JZU58_06235 [Curvibacter lanceolatus]|jgi:hypothetical protein|uniref:hypothetical protein n=1 Tax=Curvibacter lanceolatus TaxID=86182 RepID=UPI000369AC33|nr:hypothetical protein [Curvibacter lanceolatus]MBV5291934.1 hypothetical protein [Curvibacter lanceolatus]